MWVSFIHKLDCVWYKLDQPCICLFCKNDTMIASFLPSPSPFFSFETPHVDQAGLALEETHLPLPAVMELKVLMHHSQPQTIHCIWTTWLYIFENLLVLFCGGSGRTQAHLMGPHNQAPVLFTITQKAQTFVSFLLRLASNCSTCTNGPHLLI